MGPSSPWNYLIILFWNFDSNFLSGPNVIFQVGSSRPYQPILVIVFRNF